MANSEESSVFLTENDVPGAKLCKPEIEAHTKAQLSRWLSCRGLKSTGLRPELIER